MNGEIALIIFVLFSIALLLFLIKDSYPAHSTTMPKVLKFLRDGPKTINEIRDHLGPLPRNLDTILTTMEKNEDCLYIQKKWRGPLDYSSGEKQDPWVYKITSYGVKKIDPANKNNENMVRRHGES